MSTPHLTSTDRTVSSGPSHMFASTPNYSDGIDAAQLESTPNISESASAIQQAHFNSTNVITNDLIDPVLSKLDAPPTPPPPPPSPSKSNPAWYDNRKQLRHLHLQMGYNTRVVMESLQEEKAKSSDLYWQNSKNRAKWLKSMHKLGASTVSSEVYSLEQHKLQIAKKKEMGEYGIEGRKWRKTE